MAFFSQVESNNINEAINDEHWLLAIQEELNHFERNKVWELVPRPSDHPIIGTKWVFRNKLDEIGVIIRNKARVVAKGYNKKKEFIMKNAPIARLEAMRMLLTFVSIMDFKLCQMDVKRAF